MYIVLSDQQLTQLITLQSTSYVYAHRISDHCIAWGMKLTSVHPCCLRYLYPVLVLACDIRYGTNQTKVNKLNGTNLYHSVNWNFRG